MKVPQILNTLNKAGLKVGTQLLHPTPLFTSLSFPLMHLLKILAVRLKGYMFGMEGRNMCWEFNHALLIPYHIAYKFKLALG